MKESNTVIVIRHCCSPQAKWAEFCEELLREKKPLTWIFKCVEELAVNMQKGFNVWAENKLAHLVLTVCVCSTHQWRRWIFICRCVYALKLKLHAGGPEFVFIRSNTDYRSPSNLPFTQTSWMDLEAAGRGNVRTLQALTTTSSCLTTTPHACLSRGRKGWAAVRRDENFPAPRTPRE